MNSNPYHKKRPILQKAKLTRDGVIRLKPSIADLIAQREAVVLEWINEANDQDIVNSGVLLVYQIDRGSLTTLTKQYKAILADQDVH